MCPPPPQDLSAWLTSIGRPASSLTPLTGDVSRRAYLRAAVGRGQTLVVATYPPEMADVCRRFLRTTAILEGVGVRVPRILAHDCGRGLMLIEDAGETTLYDHRRRGWEHLAGRIERAAEIAEKIRRLPTAEVARLNPPLDEDLLRRELDQTWRLLLAPRDLAGQGDDRALLRGALDRICSRLASEEPVVCHRDFMARNLMPLAGDELLVLDHQDLRLGPRAYDLASLLNDSLFAPLDLERRLVARHLGQGGELSYRRCVVQRALKACGTYASFARLGSRRHLPLVPPTLRRAADSLAAIPEGRGLEAVVESWRGLDDAGA